VSDEVDLNFRPDTYFKPHKLERYLLSKVKGGVVKKKLQTLFAEGRHAEVRELLTTEALSANDRKALESFHPMFMGGNYLPDTEDGKVEIARIRIKSTTFDVTCVYARPDKGVITTGSSTSTVARHCRDQLSLGLTSRCRWASSRSSFCVHGR
jgi:hypothetical protein